MIASCSRLFAASLTVLALALAGRAGAQVSTPPAPTPETHPPAIILQPGEPTPGQPPADPANEATPDPHIVVTEAPATPPIPEVWTPVPTDADGASAYGLYLAGKLALMRGEGTAGADFLARANRLTPEQPRVREQAFTAALLTGDLDVAAALAPSDGSPAFVEAGRLVQAVQVFVHGDARAADAALAQPIGAPHARAGVMITPWIAAAAGDWTRALQPPPATADPLTLAMARISRANLLELRRDYAGAETELKGLVDAPTVGALFKRPYGEFLERRRRRPEAVALYQAGLAANPEDSGLKRALARVQARGRPPALPTFREGAAQGLTTAAFQAANERGNEFAAVYLRLALNLDYDDTTQFTLAQMLSRAGLNSAARTALERIGPDDAAVYGAARAELASSYAQEGQDQAALTELRRAAAVLPDDPRVALMLAGQLVQVKEHEAALALLNGPLLNTAQQPASVRFLRGAVYEAMNRIPEAEAELWAALQADPNNADTLNYLGYLWVDKGLRVQQGADMIARAHALEPNNGNIEDSLGWAQYRQGQYETAVTTLEQAVDKEPANAEITDHLGDAYWRVGRRREAGWLWNRVLTLDPDAERRAEVERKIADGLDNPASTGGVSD
ncbi:tetratricopeptide repeat protein [Brevundimonas sp. SORGH_AS_0993]|uniref:tetratricopeptide repeat protein n=1 Tax=Brevundimonas sp. SORGH_AS_0993 TaxID=3041794 RepID=UPI00278B8DA1|nr:tetratricopeptide repeat protein [Brevundimonas sp. SORGH_AS_0993]MDQ1154202.1 tetratricopeptide (TPR) repeat protein [Brevundimonas sp. SORGH_AS_0993]